jgi:hypothetical protein
VLTNDHHKRETTMTTDPVTFYRALPDYMTVAIDGTIDDVDPDIVSPPPARVVITMQDETAHLLAHLFDQITHLCHILDWEPDGGPVVPELATALHQAAEHAHRRCRHGLDLPPTGETTPPAPATAAGDGQETLR